MAIRFLLIFLIMPVYLLCAQDPLDMYIRHAMENNYALRQKEFSYQQSMLALDEARGMFLPSIDIQARYSRAGGGREIYFPVGDLLNPVYQTLNQLLQSNQFPTNLANENIPFLREEEHETKIRLVQPVFQPDIYYNYKIKKEMEKLKESEKFAYTRELVAEVKSAYYSYLKTEKVEKVLKETKNLLEENLRINESLYKNDKITIDLVYRAEAELSHIEQELQNAETNNLLSQQYFNFLLNRPLLKPIESDINEKPDYNFPEYEEAVRLALQNRDELRQLETAIRITGETKKLHTSAFLPNMSAVVDYGFQGEKYSFTEDDDYWMASAVLQWNLFNGFQDKSRIQQSGILKKKQELQLAETKKMIELQVSRTHQELRLAIKSIETAQKRKQAADKYFESINKKYKQNMISYIEFLDARTNMTESGINYILSIYDYLVKKAQLEKITATFEL